MRKITVMLAEDHSVVRKGLCTLLNAKGDFLIVGEARNGREAVKLARTLRPDVILMDIAMPLLNGLDATRQILDANPAAKVIILSAYSDDEFIKRADSLGVAGYLEKQSVSRILAKAIRDVAAGKTFFSPSITKRLPGGHDAPHVRTIGRKTKDVRPASGESDVQLTIV